MVVNFSEEDWPFIREHQDECLYSEESLRNNGEEHQAVSSLNSQVGSINRVERPTSNQSQEQSH
jgi:hypothetical protein